MKEIKRMTDDGIELTFHKYARKDLKIIFDQFFEQLESALIDTRFAIIQNALDYYFDDCGLFWELDDGSTGSLDISGLDGERPEINRIVTLLENGYGQYQGFFGKFDVTKNKKYGDWELVEA